MTLVFLAGAVTAVAAIAGLPATGTWVHIPTPQFLANELGRPVADTKLVRHPHHGTTVRMGPTSFGISSGDVSFGLAAQGVGNARWRPYKNGVTRHTPFGLETITTSGTKVEEFLTVGRHEGKKTWRWKFVGLRSDLTPRVGADGYVAFLVGTGAAKQLSQDAFIAPPAILDTRGKTIPEKNLRWSVSSAHGTWWLNLRVNDSKLPTPYVIDPIAIRGTATSAQTSNGTTLVLTAPTGVVANDVMIAQVTTRNNATISNSAGLAFTQIGSTVTNTTSLEQAIYRRVATASEGGSTTTFSWSGGADATGGIIAFSGVSTTAPVDVSTSNFGTTSGALGDKPCVGTCTATASAITTTQANDEILALYGTRGTLNSTDVTLTQDGSQNVTQRYTVLSGSTRLSQARSTGSSGGSVQASPGSTGNFTATINLGGTPWIAHTIALEPPLQSDGGGTVSADRTNIAASSTGNTVTFTYTAGTGGLSGGSVTVAVPSGWTAPVTANAIGCTTASTGTLSVSGQTITVSNLTLAQTNTLTITYGATSGGSCTASDGATATGTTGAATWTVKSKATAGGTLTTLIDNSSPSITVNAANGSGTNTVSPTTATAGTTNNTLTFTYTAATGGTSNGEVDVAVPAGWTAPTTSNAAGCVKASTGSIAVSGSTIKVTGVTLSGGGTMTITYGATSGGSCTASDTATAPASAGTSTFTTSEKSTNNSNDSLTNIASSPTVAVSNAADGSGTAVIAPTSVVAGSSGLTETLTYTETVAGGMSSGAVELTVPANWSAPSTVNGAAGCTTSSTGTVGVSGQVVTVTGVTLAQAGTLTITYGATSGACSSSTGASDPSAGNSGSATWNVRQRSTSGGTLTALGSSPSVNVTNAADGTGTIIVSPTSISVDSTGATFTFSYTPVAGGTNNGKVRIQVPSGWTTPSTSNVSAGYTTASGGSGGDTVSIDTSTAPCSGSSPCILVSGVTLTTAQTLTITYGSGGGATGVTVPGSTGTATFTTTEASTSGGTLSSASITSPTVTLTNGNFTTNTAVSINGTPTVGTATTLTAGSYTPSPTGMSYQWRLCDSSGASCSDISGATGSTYTPVAGDVGSTLRVVETVTRASYNNGGSTSAASPVVVNGSFVTNTAVAINGTPTVGTASTLTAGSYTPVPTGASYQWRLCDSSGASCSDISGATSSTYTPVAGDVGGTLRVVETVSKAGYNNGGSTSAASPVVVNGSFVTNTAVSVSGTPTVGTGFAAIAGSYTPTPTSSSYQWELCDSSGNSCSNISGATSSTYTPVAGDVGSTLRVVETVSKAGYNNASSTSSASAVVIKGSFTMTSAVVINGQPRVDSTSTITNGVYAPTAQSRSYQWELCDSLGNSCSNISGATSNKYTPGAGDVGSTLRVVETVTRPGYNDGGSTSSASPVVINGDFTMSVPVSINGTPTVDVTATITAGSYSPTPTSSSYQWRLCDVSGNNCSDISGATSSSYTPVPSDAGSTLRVVETVSKAGYNDLSSTSARALVINGTITTTTAVAVNGTPTVATPTTLTAGSYTPTPTSSTYQWQACDSAGNNCSNIAGATSITYKPVAANVGSTLRVVETVSKAGYNNGSSTSAASPVVVKANFSTTMSVSVNGTPTVATATTLTAGSYTPSPTSSSYQWELCDSSGNSCSNISGATSSTYTPVAGDVGSTLRVVETVSKAGYNDSGSTSAASAVVIKASFSTTTVVKINGTPTVGTATTITAGTYSPAATSKSYQWELCDSSGNSCSNISGATSNTYTPVSGDVGSTLRVVETASRAGFNDGGSTSSASPAVNGIFTTNTAVAINGTPTVGTASTITTGTYTPSPTGRSYQWQRCDSSGNNCTAISGATFTVYTPVAADVGKTLRVVETVTRSLYVNGGSTSAASPVVVKGTFVKLTDVAIFGYPKVAVTSTITQGSYTPNPTSRTYQWMVCTSTTLASCVNIASATSKTYTPVATDIGKRLRVIETVSAPGYNNLSVTSAASAAVTS